MIRSRVTTAALVLVLAVAMSLVAGSVPHLHVAPEAGYYNGEHDLTLLATLAGAGLPAETSAPLAFDTASTSLLVFAPQHPATAPAQAGDSRAPPAA